MGGGYRALTKLREQGAIKAFGAGINEWAIAERLAREGDFDVFLLAGRYTLLEQEALTSFLPYCAEKNIGVVIGGPFNSGILATGPKAGAFYNYAPAPRGDSGPRARHRGRLQGAWRQAGGGGSALPAQPSRDRQRDSRRAEGERSAPQRRNAARRKSRRALWRDLKSQGLHARRRADAALGRRIMLKHISPILGPDLLHVLRQMGHGDEIAIVDANFPAYSQGPRVVRLDGVDATRALDAILSVVPLDDFTPDACWRMQVVGAPDEEMPVFAEFRNIIAQARGRQVQRSPRWSATSSTRARPNVSRWWRPRSGGFMEILSLRWA